MDQAISRGLAYAAYADLIWCETGTPDIDEAKAFADAIHAKYPNKMLAYNCSPSFNWRRHLDDKTIATFQEDIAALGYKFQFITLAGWHGLNFQTFNLARDYANTGMAAYVDLQEREFAAEAVGYTATKHQHEVGTGYFDAVAEQTGKVVAGLTEEDMERLIESNTPGRPAQAVSARLGVILNDNIQHIGQVAFLRGLIRDQGWY